MPAPYEAIISFDLTLVGAGLPDSIVASPKDELRLMRGTATDIVSVVGSCAAQLGGPVLGPELQRDDITPSPDLQDFADGAGITHVMLRSWCSDYTPRPRLEPGVRHAVAMRLKAEADRMAPNLPMIDYLDAAFGSVLAAEAELGVVMHGLADRSEYRGYNRRALFAGSGLVAMLVGENIRALRLRAQRS